MSDAGQHEIPASADGPRVYRVAEINRRIRTALEGGFPDVWIEGEVSNFKAQSSGHWYFTLKDETAQIDAVFLLYARRRGGIELGGGAAVPRDGLTVRVHGRISVYEPRGRYQIVVDELRESGLGPLQKALEELKRKLKAEGLFDRPRQALPLLPQHVAIVTSPTGAAIRDILNIVGRRFPNVHITIFGVRVQGRGAAAEIAEAIAEANRRQRRGDARFDVLIVGRGGGSIEDLWAFNEEAVARAVAASEIPTLSAVGHQTDHTLCDDVADLAAPTPSAAAELLVGRKDEFVERLRTRARDLRLQWDRARLERRNGLGDLRSRLVRHRPDEQIRTRRRELELHRRDLRAVLESAARQAQQRRDEAAAGLRAAWERRRDRGRNTLDRLRAQLSALGPESVLRRGYSMTLLEDGRVLRAPDQARAGARLTTRLLAGEVSSVVVKPGAARPAARPGPPAGGEQPLLELD